MTSFTSLFMRNAFPIYFIFLTLLLAPLAGCQNPTAVEPEEITIQVMWVPNAQFAGYYTAIEKGFYREEGLEVRFNPYDENVAVRDAVAVGEADFGIDGADEVLIGRGEGQPLTAVFVDYRIDPTAFASLAESGISHPEDWRGKTIGILPDSTGTIFKAVMAEYGLGEDEMSFVEYGYDFAMLTDGTVDVIPVYIFDEPYALEQMGYETNTILAYDFGISSYGDTLFTTESMLAEQPDLVEKFVRATQKGWRYALEHREEAIDIVLQYDDEGYHDRAYETHILSHEAPLVHTGEDQIGWMKTEVWQEMYTALFEAGMLQNPFDVTEAFSNRFVPNE
jgi:NitT/TauT family transport system substrate-binding protein